MPKASELQKSCTRAFKSFFPQAAIFNVKFAHFWRLAIFFFFSSSFRSFFYGVRRYNSSFAQREGGREGGMRTFPSNVYKYNEEVLVERERERRVLLGCIEAMLMTMHWKETCGGNSEHPTLGERDRETLSKKFLYVWGRNGSIFSR